MKRAVLPVPERLGRLDHARVGPFELRLTKCLPHRFSGWRYFYVHLVSTADRSREPVLWGLFSVGGKGVQPWIECDYTPQVSMKNAANIDLHASNLHVKIFRVLAEILPADGHVAVAYEGSQHEETHRGIRLRVPPVATELGAALFRAGFRGGFKDWYFAEGGHEGPVKMQANKPHDTAHEAVVAATIKDELRNYLERPLSELYPEIDERGRKRARALLTLI